MAAAAAQLPSSAVVYVRDPKGISRPPRKNPNILRMTKQFRRRIIKCKRKVSFLQDRCGSWNDTRIKKYRHEYGKCFSDISILRVFKIIRTRKIHLYIHDRESLSFSFYNRKFQHSRNLTYCDERTVKKIGKSQNKKRKHNLKSWAISWNFAVSCVSTWISLCNDVVSMISPGTAFARSLLEYQQRRTLKKIGKSKKKPKHNLKFRAISWNLAVSCVYTWISLQKNVVLINSAGTAFARSLLGYQRRRTRHHIR